MEKLAGDLLLGLKFVKLEILSTSFIDFLYEVLGELRSRSLGLNGLSPYQVCDIMHVMMAYTKTHTNKNLSVSSIFACFERFIKLG